MAFDGKWNLFAGSDVKGDEVPEGVVHWLGPDKPWHPKTKVWRPELWRSEQAGWEHLRMGIWDKPEVVELDPDDGRMASVLAERGWKVRVAISPGWDRPEMDGFPDLSVEEEGMELPEGGEVRLGTWAEAQGWLREGRPLPEQLVLRGWLAAAEVDRIRSMGYGREFRLVAGEWPAGGPAGRVLEHEPVVWGTGLEAGEWLYLRREGGGKPSAGLRCEARAERAEEKAGAEKIAVVAMPGEGPLSRAWLKSVENHFLAGYDVGVYELGEAGLVRLGVEGIDVGSTSQGDGAAASGCDGVYGKLLAACGALAGWDHVYLLSRRLRVMAPVGREILAGSAGSAEANAPQGLVAEEGGLVAVLHPGYHDVWGQGLPYEGRVESAARVGPHEGRRYFTGVLQGGSRTEFLGAVKGMAAMEDADRQADVTALWGLESYWNRYLINTPPCLELGPGYGRSEHQAMEFPLKLAVIPCRGKTSEEGTS